MIRSEDIIFLLGAGASAEAEIPTSANMIQSIEALLRDDSGWQPFLTLYNHVKSAIHYQAGLRGEFGDGVSFNIETLVNALYELERNELHPLYPFIASWNSRFVALAGPGFDRVRDFRRMILKELKKWMCPEDPSKGDYYSGFARLQKDLNYPLHVFSLNYDLCIERLTKADFRVESGFAGHGPNNVWDWERFESPSAEAPPQILLYKLHGSINWKRNRATKELFSLEQVESVEPDLMEVIFGRDFKLEAADPYLFYAYAFRHGTLNAKLIVVVGYGFGDSHINKMLTQGVRKDTCRRVLVVRNCAQEKIDTSQEEIGNRLDLNTEEKQRLVLYPSTAKAFLENSTLKQILQENMPPEQEAPF